MLKLFTGVLISILVFAGCASGGSSAAGGASGTATATAQGFGGAVSVTVVMDKGKIINAIAEGPMETMGIGTRALINIPFQMKEKNSVQIDVVGGATITSNAVLEAAKAAVAQIRQ